MSQIELNIMGYLTLAIAIAFAVTGYPKCWLFFNGMALGFFGKAVYKMFKKDQYAWYYNGYVFTDSDCA